MNGQKEIIYIDLNNLCDTIRPNVDFREFEWRREI